jgi:hypothetical protein
MIRPLLVPSRSPSPFKGSSNAGSANYEAAKQNHELKHILLYCMFIAKSFYPLTIKETQQYKQS